MGKGRQISFFRRMLLFCCKRGHIRVVYSFSGSHCTLLDVDVYVLFPCIVRC